MKYRVFGRVYELTFDTISILMNCLDIDNSFGLKSCYLEEKYTSKSSLASSKPNP